MIQEERRANDRHAHGHDRGLRVSRTLYLRSSNCSDFDTNSMLWSTVETYKEVEMDWPVMARGGW